jgi:hypothetical protein
MMDMSQRKRNRNSRIIVSPDPAILSVGENIQFNALGITPDGKKLSLLSIEWNVEDDIGEIDQNGVFFALAPGKGKVKATALILGRKVSGYADVVVKDKRELREPRFFRRKKPYSDIIPVEPMPPTTPTPMRIK